MASALNELSATQAARWIADGRIRSEDLVRACLDRTAQREPEVAAWAALDPERALAAARQADATPAAGPLHGVPIGIKDVIDTADLPTGMGSPIYAGHQPRADASCVAMLKAAGAIVLGKTVTCEFAGSAPGATQNPWDRERTPGGSSSGSAAAVADRMVPLALGTQTGGSVLRPASFCGIVGFKPTYGTINRMGLKFAAESLDTIGMMARDPEDIALCLHVLTWSPPPQSLDDPERLRIGICRTPLWDKAEAETRAALDHAAQLAAAAGAELTEIDLPGHFSELGEARAIINDVERARSLAWEWARHRDAISPQMVRQVEHGHSVSGERYHAALRFAERARWALDPLLEGVDVLLAPCVNGEAPPGLHYAGDPSFQGLWTLLHVPTVSLPAIRGPHGMPVGVQLVGRRYSDLQVLAAARWLIRRAGLHGGTAMPESTGRHAIPA
ncbi:amidase [Faunimonas sp. B44]|uniref:amidase n=1 Tax=Faunimonas sp. B44 TaxID=3461493 RepID=UPI00404494F3